MRTSFIILASDIKVSITYLQLLEEMKITPEVVVLQKLEFEIGYKNKMSNYYKIIRKKISELIIPVNHIWKNEFKSSIKQLYRNKLNIDFDPKLNIYEICNRNNWKLILHKGSCNDNKLKDTLNRYRSDYVLYCANDILKSLLDLDKKFIHVHPGYVPDIKGSDCLLYSALIRNKIGMSAFFMSKGIDSGEIICRAEYEIEKFKFSYLYKDYFEFKEYLYNYLDPLYRAVLMKRAILMIDENKLNLIKQSDKEGDFYYLMHSKLIELACKKFVE